MFTPESKASRWHMYGGPGVSYYQGDVFDATLPSLKELKFSAKLGVGYTFHHRWTLRVHGTYANLHASDGYSGDPVKNARGITFNTTVIDAGFTVKYKNFFKKTRRVMNYAFIGFDYMNLSVERTLDPNGSAALRPVETFSPNQFNIPVGFGLGYWFNTKWGIVNEFCYHKGLTDFIDGTSANANPKSLDSFVVDHIMLIYRFGYFGTNSSGGGGDFDPSNLNNVECPRF